MSEFAQSLGELSKYEAVTTSWDPEVWRWKACEQCSAHSTPLKIYDAPMDTRSQHTSAGGNSSGVKCLIFLFNAFSYIVLYLAC